ncbi:hypothetical protein EXM22_02565 [Oceanispirochaeta crateris]|uniref:Uncharacterized protein n=1 Tax=Oceanispirochaeta crateris TaxID=2518645 RepID=A0A5C1QIR6_9SPIO|nr:hypothetical protein [Oceanispirochaeta crateris]QEN06930.1 hypothetical protein EXM22_02565 [Oceanispirochaeta crateris]
MSSFLSSLYRKKRIVPAMIFLSLMLFCLIGLWMTITDGVSVSSFVNKANGIVFFLGVIGGIFPFSLPLLLIIPYIFSFFLNVPVRGLRGNEDKSLGELHFYPSNEGVMSLEWRGEDGTYHILQLEGEKVALAFVRHTVSGEFFFLESGIEPLGIVSGGLTIPVSDLPEESTPWFYSLRSASFQDSILYQNTYPALKYLSPGYFSVWSYKDIDGQLRIIRK